MPTAASFAATLLYLVPVAVVLVCRARRERPLWAAAIDVPLAVACDLLLVLTMARFVTLETAAFASRVIWLTSGAVYLVVRRRAPDGPAWPQAAGKPEVIRAGLTGAAGAWLSTLGSRPYSIWDRKWHTPLTASLRGQRIPFETAMAKGEVLHYHFSGDVQAAMVQSFSLDVIHSSLALSVGHDILFGLIGVTLAILLAGLGERRALVAVVATSAALLAGPYTLWRDPAHPHIDGYSVLNYYSMSFRPHDALAGLFFLGIVGALSARVWGGPARLVDTAPALLGSAAGLAISDETSLGLIGLSLGLTWLVCPEILHPRRAAGAAILVGLLAAFIVPNVAFAASIAPGAQSHTAAFVPFRSPGCYTPLLLLSTRPGQAMLLADLGPTALIWLGGVLGAIAARRRRSWALLAFATGLFVLSTLALTCVEVNHEALESHRFMTGAVFLAPVISLLVMLPQEAPGAVPEAPPPPGRLRAAGSVACVAGVLLGSASTVDWIVNVLPVRGHRQDHFFTKEDLYSIDCRRDFGVTLGDRARPFYLSKSIWYAYAGCQPTFAPGRHDNAQWALTIGNPYFFQEAVRVLRRTALRPEDPLTVICERQPSATSPDPPAQPAPGDPVCAYARRHATCHDLGTRLTECELTPQQQAEVAR